MASRHCICFDNRPILFVGIAFLRLQLVQNDVHQQTQALSTSVPLQIGETKTLEILPLYEMELVGEAENGEQAVVRANLLQPDVILMDLMMPVMDGVAAAIKKQNPAIQIIALTSFQEDGLVQSALQAGAIGYLMKNVTARELAAAIKAAKEGKLTLSPEATQALVHASQQAQETETLSERECEVLKLMVDGLSNAEIADQLVVSVSTVKYHISNILMKLGVDNRVAAVTTALQKKLV